MTDRPKSEMELSSTSQRATRGWSDWDVRALGLDNTFFVDLSQVVNDRSISNALVALSDETEFAVLDVLEGRAASEAIAAITEDAENIVFAWLMDPGNLDIVLRSGHVARNVLSEILVYFGSCEPHGWPDVVPYGDDGGYERYCRDAVLAGQRLLSEDILEYHAAVAWLRRWHGSIWD